MLNYVLNDLTPQMIMFQIVMLLIVISNVWLLRRARRHVVPIVLPKVSFLVPARNEERNIARCLRSLLAQDYPDFEVLVLDDHSSDDTAAILCQLGVEYSQLRVFRGSELPPGCLGKSWACDQLAQQAEGDLLFFTDADTQFQPHALRASVTALLGEQASLLTGFPRQQLGSWGERMIVPFFSWAFVCFTPLALAYRVRMPSLSMAVGQMMLFRRADYAMIGGHQAVLGSIVEDMHLARLVRTAGLRWRVVDATDLITCRMYTTSRQAFEGFAKNYFAAFNFRLLPFLFVFGWLAALFWLPPCLIILHGLGGQPFQALNLPAAWVCVALSLLLWLLPYAYLRLPLWLAALYPLTLWLVSAVGFDSLYASFTGRLCWKDRRIEKPHWRWL